MKGQTAVEYLMTYGWAILIILIVAGVLIYYGIFEPNGFLLKRNYSSETKAFDIGHFRCDFYIEYLNETIINITKTDCIILP